MTHGTPEAEAARNAALAAIEVFIKEHRDWAWAGLCHGQHLLGATALLLLDEDDVHEMVSNAIGDDDVSEITRLQQGVKTYDELTWGLTVTAMHENWPDSTWWAPLLDKHCCELPDSTWDALQYERCGLLEAGVTKWLAEHSDKPKD